MNELINNYISYLKEEEKSEATCAQYRRELLRFSSFCYDKELTKERLKTNSC